MTRSSERGTSLIVGILACALLGVAVGILSQDLGDRQRSSRHLAAVAGLTHLTDAGLAVSLAGLAADPAFEGMRSREIGGGRAWSRVQKADDMVVTVSVRAELDEWTGVLDAEVELTPDGPVVRGWRRHTERAADG